MAEKVIVGPVNSGLRTDRTPFVIDNDSFPTLINAYQWRGRVKRKRGTSFLNRLQRFFNSAVSTYGSTSSIVLNGSGQGNLLTGFSLQSNGNIIPGTVAFTDATAAVNYTDPAKNGTLSPSGTINYATGLIDIGVGSAGDTVNAVSFVYYPDLPVLGIEDLNLKASQFPGNLAFDKTYSYNVVSSSPYNVYDVSFYLNPITGSYAGYTQKINWTATSWNGQTYQQFWTTNYQNALWATNGINVPFSVTNIGMQFQKPASATQTSATTVDFVIAGSPLVIGDFVFANEFTGTSGATLNFQTGYVTNVNAMTSTYTVTFPNAAIGAAGLTPGILQYLTNRSDVTKDCLRWYNGDPTNGSVTAPTFQTGQGWVNFAPPLVFGANATFTIADLPPAQYYLVGARIILPFKDRLLFIGPVIQTSSANSQVYLQDTVIYSQNGTPYYTASFTGDPTLANTVFNPILVPVNQTSSPGAYFEDLTGFGGFITAGFAQPIVTAGFNEDVLILGFSNRQSRFIYTGTNFIPFNFFVINSEFGSTSTFSSITLDRGVLTIGNNGIVQTSQIDSKRIDLEIPDQIFQFNLTNNGPERITAQRDFINEWIYFTYLSDESSYIFPNQTLQYNYRDNSWAIFNESFTTYGTFRALTGDTWGTIGQRFSSWESWAELWSAGSTTLLQPKVLGGNQQGFLLLREDGTSEGNCLYIQGFSGSTVTSPDHCLNNNDYIVISGCLGTIGSIVNGNIYSVSEATQNTFVLNPPIGSGTYLGGGVIKRMYVPQVQTKEFPVSWGLSRKTRLGPQQYLLTRTNNGQITLLIFLSQNQESAYNIGPIIPAVNSINGALVYSTVLYTCPESTNLGLTPANINLNLVTAGQQDQIWHRINTSLLGDTVQLGFTMSDSQMRDTTFSNQFAEIELHAFILDVNPSQLLA